MTVDAKAVSDMANILRALNGQGAIEEPTNEVVLTEEEKAARKSEPKGDPNVDAMKNILEQFYAVSNETVEHAQAHPALREAVQTVQTPQGARIGSWEITVHEDENRRTYDVVNVQTGEPIAKELHLYEAAYGLARHLNDGVTINDGRVRKLLRLEEEFVRNRTDAAQFKSQRKRLKEKGETTRVAIAEDRFDEAQRRAKEARDHILKLAGLL